MRHDRRSGSRLPSACRGNLGLAAVMLLCAISAPAAEESQSFHSVIAGMTGEAAFQRLCQSGARLIATDLLLSNGKESFISRPLTCADWAILRQADIWTLQDLDAPCATDFAVAAVFSLVEDRVEQLRLHCARVPVPDPP